jgi:hypothetical protein
VSGRLPPTYLTEPYHRLKDSVPTYRRQSSSPRKYRRQSPARESRSGWPQAGGQAEDRPIFHGYAALPANTPNQPRDFSPIRDYRDPPSPHGPCGARPAPYMRASDRASDLPPSEQHLAAMGGREERYPER